LRRGRQDNHDTKMPGVHGVRNRQTSVRSRFAKRASNALRASNKQQQNTLAWYHVAALLILAMNPLAFLVGVAQLLFGWTAVKVRRAESACYVSRARMATCSGEDHAL
jgi:hypothetical protein